jgi:predicted nuclease of predicted toxin-antitoxin system
MRPRLLLNENVPLPSAKLLRASGWDALAIADGYSSIDDATVMRLAREESRWLITSDRDYRQKGSYRQKRAKERAKGVRSCCVHSLGVGFPRTPRRPAG